MMCNRGAGRILPVGGHVWHVQCLSARMRTVSAATGDPGTRTGLQPCLTGA